jgi:hypothetical protein
MENEAIRQSLQAELDSIDRLDESITEQLLISVAKSNDAKATVFVYDRMKKRGLVISDQCKQSLDDLESVCRKKQNLEIFSVPSESKRTLSAERRIHKICKGSRMRKRLADSKQHLEKARAWLKENSDRLKIRGPAKARIQSAKVLSKELNIPFEAARGLVTHLKRSTV